MESASLDAQSLFKSKTQVGVGACLLSACILVLSIALQLWRTNLRRKYSSLGTQQQHLPLPPGRLGMGLLGESCAYLGSKKRNVPWEFIEERVAKYGEIFKTHLIGHPTIVVPNPAGNKMVFTSKLLHVSWPASVVRVLGKRALIELQGDEGNRIRHAMMAFLGPEALQVYAGKADKSFQSFIHAHWEGKSLVNVYPLMKRFTFSLACELLMSRYEKEEQEMLKEPFTVMMKGLLQLPINLPGTRYNKAIAAANMLRSQFQPWIDERRRDLAVGKISDDHDMLSCLLSYVDEDGKPLSDMDIKDNILLLLFAGHDTTTTLITMLCKFLASNPSVFEEVYKENKEILNQKGPNVPLSWADIQKMKLSWRVVQETLRLQPPVQGSFRVAIQDFEYCGFRIPKGWKVYWTGDSTQRDTKYFSEPSKFDPSRFEGIGPAPYTFIPFGAGPRMCPGNEFARVVALVVMHNLVTRFSWTLVDPHEVIIVDPMPYPEKGLSIHLKPRIA